VAQAVYNAKLYKLLEEKVQELELSNKKLETTQRKLIQSDKLAAIGQLAAGVAHELNNPLTGIMGFSQILLQNDTFTHEQRDDLECIQKESKRCRDIIQNLLHFSRRKEPKKELLDILPLLDSVVQLVNYEYSTSGIDIIRELPSHCPKIWGDSSQLQQVLVNIITNAQHAMKGKAHPQLCVKVATHERYVRLEFKDNGSGIPSENLGKIFDPFFTTKPVGEGTGLGLSISYGIIQEHQGRIWAESSEGIGTTMFIEFPIAPTN
jgi:two-component system NtrC family sensor kinase